MDWDAIKLGLKASVISSACCSTPLILGIIAITTSLFSLTAAISIAKYKYEFLALGFIFYLLAAYINLKSKCKGVCNIDSVKRNRGFLLGSFITFIITSLLLIYLILPLLAKYVYTLL